MNAQINKALIKATKRSTHKRHQTGCVIVDKKGEILSTGCSHSSSFRMNELHSIHAEIHALGLGRHKNLNGATAYVCTIARKSGNKTYSAPCLTCAIALKSAGIEEVVFSVGGMDDWCEHLVEWLIQDANLKVYPRRK
jgi:deoxycytidylate deaminase